MGTHSICLCKEVDKRYTGCNLKIKDLLDCVLIGVCSIIMHEYIIFFLFILLCRNQTEEGMDWENTEREVASPTHDFMGQRPEILQLEDVVVNFGTRTGEFSRGPKINISAIISACVQNALSMVKDKEADVGRTTKRVALVLELLQTHTQEGKQALMSGFLVQSVAGCKFESTTKTCLFKYIENFTSKNRKFSDKKLLYFSYFCSKYRLWVLFRSGYSLELPQLMSTHNLCF